MSIASRISEIEQHLTDDYSVLTLAGANLTNVDKNIINLKPTWKERLLYFINNGTDVVWNNWTKVQGTGTILTLNNTLEAPMNIDLKGNTYQGLPSGYQAVEYIQSSGTQYIDTGISPTLQTGVKIKADLTTDNNTDNILFGSRATSGNTRFWLDFDGSNDNILYGYGSYGTIQAFSLNTMYDISFNYNGNGKVNINGTETTMTTTPDFTNSKPIYLFRANYTSALAGNFKIYHCQIYNGTTKVRDLIPCYRTSDNTIGMYETVEGKFYTNQGTGTFTKGNNITLPTPDTPIPVNVVSGDNTIKVEGKNLCNGVNQNYFITPQALAGVYQNNSGLIIKVDGVSKYTISTKESQERYRVGCIDTIPQTATANVQVYGYVDKGGTSDSVTLNTTGHNYILVNCTNLTAIQVEKSESASAYTPYVSQTYPINLGELELCKIGTYQDKIAKSTGKNLFDIGTSSNDYTPTNYISSISNNIITMAGAGGASSRCIRLQNFATNKTYTIGFDTNVNTNRGLIRIRNSSDTGWLTKSDITFDGWTYNGTYGAWYKDFTKSGNRATVTTTIPNGLYWQFGIVNAYKETETFSNIQIEESNQATPYEPYGKVWYLNKQIGKVVLDGSESGWVKYGAYGSNSYLFYIDNQTDALLPDGTRIGYGYGLTNYFTWTDKTDNTGIAPYVRFQYNNGKRIYFAITQDLALENWGTWLSTHNTIVYYVLTTPTYTEITDTTLLSQLNALENANSYNNQTNVSQANNDLASILNATALKEM